MGKLNHQEKLVIEIHLFCTFLYFGEEIMVQLQIWSLLWIDKLYSLATNAWLTNFSRINTDFVFNNKMKNIWLTHDW